MIQDRSIGLHQQDSLRQEVVRISDEIQEICVEAFKEASHLKTVVAACTSLRKIGYGAFWNCRQLVQVNVVGSSLQEIADMAFCGCSSLQTMDMPDTVVEIGRFAFQECKSLVYMNLPPRLEILGQYAYASCSALCHVSIPGTVQVIENHCFSSCRSLRNVELQEGLTHIGEYAFLDCISLSTISIPGSTIVVGAGAFCECVNLLAVEFFPESDICLELEAFRNCYNLVNFYSPSLTMEEAMDYEVLGGCSGLLLGMDNNEKFHRLQSRFENLPVHRACYHASTTKMDELLVALAGTDTAIAGDGKNWKDTFGMTPFHIVATSAKLRIDMLQVLLDHYPLNTLSETDVHGRTMIDYLVTNSVPKSVEIIKLILEKTLLKRLEKWGWNRKLIQPLSTQIESMEWEQTSSNIILRELEYEADWWEAEWQATALRRRQALKEVITMFEQHAVIEVTALLELGLWKQRFVGFNAAEADRERSRMTCGVEVVIPNVIGFLGFRYGERLGNIPALIFDRNVP